ncbi:MAG: SusE domain-containing protein [Alistipes sp.]|nr:SusE domain-containing protein [Alistipes sp.]
MKIWKYILSAAALLSMGACNHEADEMVVPTRNLNIAAHSAVVVNDVTAAEEFTLTWTAAKFGVQTDVEYAVSGAVNGAEAVALATTSNLFYSTTNGELLAALGISMGGEYNVDFTVTASAEGLESVKDTISVVITLDKEAVLNGKS